MTTPENPERLWAAKYRDEDGFEYVAVFEQPEHAEGSHCHGTDARVQAYVREDVASDEARLFRDQRNILASKLATAEDEATALRRERDALRLVIERHCINGDQSLMMPDSHPTQTDLDHELSFESGAWHLSRFCKKNGGGYEWRTVFSAGTLSDVLAEASRVGALAPTGTTPPRSAHVTCTACGAKRGTPENPERLWAAKYRDEDGFEYVAVFEQPEHAEESHRHGADADVQAYVREDVASDEARLFRDQRNVLASKLATAEDEARLFRDQRNVLASKLATAEDEATALRQERDALRLAMKAAGGRIYLLRGALCLIEGDFSASSERAKIARDWDNALRDGTWTPHVDPACRCGHPASVHAVDDEERRQCLRGECDCGQYDHDAAAAGKGVG